MRATALYRNRFWNLKLRFAIGIAVVSSVAIAGNFIWKSQILQSALRTVEASTIQSLVEAGFTIQEILVQGRNQTESDDVMAVLGVKRGDPIIGLSLEDKLQRLEGLPWVRTARIERRLPHTLFIDITEREPLALWQNNSKITLVDQDGVAIPEKELSSFYNLPIIVGPDAPKYAPDFLAMLSGEPELKERIAALIRVSGRRWNIELDNGIKIELPEENPAAAWAHLAKIDKEHNILQRNIKVIDMRLPDRMIVRMPNGGTENLQDLGHNT